MRQGWLDVIDADPERLTPLRDRVLIEVLEEESVLPSGLIIPDNVMPGSCQGVVVSCGPWVTDPDIQEGLHVLFEPIQEESWFFQGHEYVLTEADKIIGIMEGNDSARA